jgi:hypothetical protein
MNDLTEMVNAKDSKARQKKAEQNMKYGEDYLLGGY